MDNEQCLSFTKEERVTGEKRIESLFTHGKSFVAYPLRVVYITTCEVSPVPVSVLVSIPKKRIRQAVKRNRVKRLIREAYRLNKHSLNTVETSEHKHLDIAFIYISDEIADFATIEKGVIKAMIKLNNLLDAGSGRVK